jgi:peptidoglycan/xylan/chitin deacetylase (PgdA/CDA1 family)
MDHGHYPFAPLPARAPLKWPDRARLAFTVVLHVEHWELDPPEDARRDPRFVGEFGSFRPDYRSFSQREYGNRVGIFRVMEVLDRHKPAVTVAMNASACRRYPFLVREFTQRGWEIAAHGSHATRLIHEGMGEAEERAVIADAIAAVERASGQRPAGWISQDFGESTRTPALVAEAGLDYVMDWPNDDQPYLINPARPVVSIPAQAEWNDVELLWLRRVPMPRYPALVRDAFETLWEEGATSGRFFGLAVHAWLMGQAHRIRYLDEALAAVAPRDAVWRAQAREVAAWIRSRPPA